MRAMRREDFNLLVARFLTRGLWKCVVLVLALLAARSSIGDWSVVPSASMEPTILPGDRIYVNKLAYDLKLPFTTRHIATWAAPARGEVVILRSPADGLVLVKRVVGVPGDLVPFPSGGEGVWGVIPPDKYFVAGDNRDHSVDSRSFGLVDRKLIQGRAAGVIVSLDPDHHSLPRSGRNFLKLK